MQEFIARLLIDSDRKTLSYLKRLIIGHFPLANEQRIRFIKLFLEKGLPIPSDSLENILTSCINHSLKEKLLDLLLSHQIRPSGSTLTTILKITEENDCIHFLSLIQPYCSPTDLYCSSQKVLKDIDSLKKQKKSLHFFMFQEKSNLQKIIEFYEKVVEILYRPVEKQECTFTSPSGQFYRVTATSVKDLQKIIEEENKEPECNTPLEKELYELYKKMKAKKIDPKEILKPATLDQKTLKISYYKLMQKYHPDKFSSNIRLQKAAHNVAVEINRAYEQLKDKC